MIIQRNFLALVLSLLFSGCAVVPTLEQATGGIDHAESNVLIANVVQRVKCEVADAFDEKLRDPRFLWLEDWTLKADLTLQANTQAGVAPSGSYTKYQRNGFNFDAGSSSLTTNSISAVPQFFTVAVGANLGEQATRTEVVSFSLALKELRAWRAHVRAIEQNPDYPPEMRCIETGKLGLAGNLGLKEWVDSAFYPVEGRELLAGFHPAPGTSKAPTAPGATAPPKSIGAGAPPAAAPLTDEEKEKLRKQITDGYTAVKASILAAQGSVNDVDAINTAVRSALKAMRYKQMVYAPVATQQVNASIALAAEQLRKLAALTATDFTDASTVPPKLSLIREDAQKRLDDLSSLNPAYQVDAANVTKDMNDADSFAKSAKTIAEHAQAVQKIAAQIGVNPDPPIDSVLHSVQFVLAYGASVTPSWTMIQWKGPALNGPAASGQGQRTHILQLALGPRTVSDKITAEQARLIQNATVLLSRP
ncbi:hypothetical protein [Bradyrhizobium sp. NAS96.2]|uniref:hypothetical protein n=1 Tax=Bradyrhizobium sp. NAS96.2 TaxID=1680160 RepID=UPI000939A8FD|nr:hypothetical protein [Bradyrhizobium sp. NAS96.2]OKO83267.1 hypothetical protein AC628_02330 [Bradyrhizobium sp. NAS96.2]